MFSKNIRTIYLYLVCLITLFMIIGGLIATLYSVSEYIFPYEYRGSYFYDYIEDRKEYGKISLDDYKEYLEIAEYEDELENKTQRRNDLKEIIYSASVFVVALPIYIYNWRKIEKEKAENINNESDGE